MTSCLNRDGWDISISIEWDDKTIKDLELISGYRYVCGYETARAKTDEVECLFD